MNTNNLKRFAQEARRKLMEQIGAKLNYVLNADSAILREQAEQVQQLRLALDQTSKGHLIEKVAYTWFNRLMALRFMDANDYQPIGIRIITPKEGYTTPEILDEAKRGNIPEELKFNRQKIYDLLDGRIPSNNPQNEAYKQLLIASCNHLSTVFPFLFEKINDYTELLLPDDLTSDFSIVTDVRNGMLVDDCQDVEIIGWLYQFYISEKKDEVFASKSAVKKEDIPAATQLFTPRWIVEYMVQNTLGKLWLQNRPKSKLGDYMPYFIESESLKAEDYLKIDSPEEIRFADPASGSGHILVYAFDLFTKIYEEEGYNSIDIPKLIFEKNLFGFEIDERAAQLSGLALMMKAREYQLRVFKSEIQPNITCFQDLRLTIDELKSTLASLQIKLSDNLLHDILLIKQATNFGSLIIPQSDEHEIIRICELLNQAKSSNNNLFSKYAIEELETAFAILKNLSLKYHCIAANPPYMGSGNMNSELANFVKSNYPDSKADMMTCFMESILSMLLKQGIFGMINLPSWLFLTSFENLRSKLIKNKHIDSLLHMGRGIFGIDWGSTAFIIQNQHIDKDSKYFKLHKRNFQHIYAEDIQQIFLKAKTDDSLKIDFDKYRDGDGIKTVDELIDSAGLQISYTANQKDFRKIPENPICYWLPKVLLDAFKNEVPLGDKVNIRAGLQTGDTLQFLRLWNEVAINKFTINNGSKWFPIQKGGSFRRWYGNQEYIVNWENKGKEIHDFIKVPYDYNGALRRAKSFYSIKCLS